MNLWKCFWHNYTDCQCFWWNICTAAWLVLLWLENMKQLLYSEMNSMNVDQLLSWAKAILKDETEILGLATEATQLVYNMSKETPTENEETAHVLQDLIMMRDCLLQQRKHKQWWKKIKKISTTLPVSSIRLYLIRLFRKQNGSKKTSQPVFQSKKYNSTCNWSTDWWNIMHSFDIFWMFLPDCLTTM